MSSPEQVDCVAYKLLGFLRFIGRSSANAQTLHRHVNDLLFFFRFGFEKVRNKGGSGLKKVVRDQERRNYPIIDSAPIQT